MDDDAFTRKSGHSPVVPATAERGASPVRSAAVHARPGRIPESELARLRALAVPAVLASLGFERDPKDPAYNWKSLEKGMRISLERANLQVWHDHERHGASRQLAGRFGGAGAIDVVRYVLDMNFREAASWLGGAGVSVAPVPRAVGALGGNSLERLAVSAAGEHPLEPAILPTPVPNALQQVRQYLTEVRAIPESIVEDAINDGRLFGDQYRNAVFRLDDLKGDVTKTAVGYAVRGTWDRPDNDVKPFHGNRGEKGLFVAGDPAARVAVFVESAIDALSYQAVRGNALVLATSGSAVDEPVRVAVRLARAGYKIVTGYDADASGDRLSMRLAESLEPMKVSVTRDRPDERFKDWNQQLQTQRQAAKTDQRRQDGVDVSRNMSAQVR
jgi:hypothetical protein